MPSLIRFETNGEAAKSMRASHRNWTVAGDQTRIRRDDGWHDVTCKVGDRHEKFASAPASTSAASPNVTDAHKVDSKP